jgi:Leucine-rich repeat (LRR) protein
MNDIIELWTYLINFIDSNKSKKILKLKSILGNEKKRQKVYHIIKNEIEFLKPIFNIQKNLKTLRLIAI